MDALGDLLIDTPAGNKVPLASVADIVSSAGPNTINRENLNRKLVVSCNATGGELANAVAALVSCQPVIVVIGVYEVGKAQGFDPCIQGHA